MGRAAKRYIVPYVVGLAPALLVALTWTPDGDWSPLKIVIRNYSAPIIGAELFAIMVALAEGLPRALARWTWPRPVTIAAATLLVIALVTAFLAPARGNAVLLTAYWLIHVLFGVAIFYLCGRVFEPADVVRAYMVGFAVFVAEFVLYLIMIPDWHSFNWKGGFMAFGHIRHAGYYLAAMAALGMGVMAAARGRGEWLWAWASASAAVGAALWTGSRGAALAIAGTLVIGVLIIPAMRFFRAWGGGFAALAVGLGVVWLAPAAPSYLMGLSRAVEQTASGDVTTGRTIIWEGVIGAVRERPLFGYGEGQMRIVAPYSTMVQPHDSILQMTLAWGVVGLLCALIIAFAFARRAIPAVRREEGPLVPAFMAMTAIAVLSLYDGSLYYALPQSIFAACAAAIASRWRMTVSENQTATAPSAVQG
jgi:hypothetical protein